MTLCGLTNREGQSPSAHRAAKPRAFSHYFEAEPTIAPLAWLNTGPL
jgi:hypothetical protein